MQLHPGPQKLQTLAELASHNTKLVTFNSPPEKVLFLRLQMGFSKNNRFVYFQPLHTSGKMRPFLPWSPCAVHYREYHPPQAGLFFKPFKIQVQVRLQQMCTCCSYQYGQHATETAVLVLIEVAVFKHLVLAFQTLIGVETNHENLTAESPGPSLF